MKILHLVQNYYPSLGGSQFMFQRFSEELVATYGDQVEVFTTNALYDPASHKNKYIEKRTERVGNVSVHRFSFFTGFSLIYRGMSRLSARFGLPFPFRDFFSLLNTGPVSLPMFRAIRAWRGDVMASTAAYYLNSIYPILARSKDKKNIPFVIYGALHLHNRRIPGPTLWAVKKADAYLAHTIFERDTLVQRGVESKKIYIVGAGVSLEDFADGDGAKIRSRYGIQDSPLVLFLGRQAYYKGIGFLLNAMRLVWKTLPDAYVLVAGSETPYSAELQKMVAEFSEPEKAKTILLGAVGEKEKADYLAACDVFVSVSTEESFGIVYAEAWASKKPVIAARMGVMESLIDDGVDGVLVTPGNAAELESALLQLLQNKALAVQVGQRGFEKVRDRYQWKVVTEKLRSVYTHVIESSSV